VNIKDTKTLIKALFRRQIESGTRYCVELESAPGVGKSEAVFQVAAELSKEYGEPVDCRQEMLSTREQPDVAGFAIPARDPVDQSHIMVRTKAPWMPLAGASRYGLLFLDEFRQAAPEVQKPGAELMLNGRVGESALPITWMVLSASNRESDRSGVHRSLAFIENRRMLVPVEFDVDTWVSWAEKAGVHPFAIAFVKTHPSVACVDKVPDKSGPFSTPRTIVKVASLIDHLPANLLGPAAAGYLGETAGAQLMAFLRVASELPSYDDIVDAPDTAKVPSRPDANYAVMQMLIHRIKPKDVKAIFTYLARMGREYQITGVRSCLNRHLTIVQTPEFGKWVSEPETKKLLLAANQMVVKK